MRKTPTTPDTGGSTTGKPSDTFALSGPFAEYLIDATQRTILFWDVLRRRSAQYYEHKAMAVPHVLSFDIELVLDGRELERPANYLLMRVKPPQGMAIDPEKRIFFWIGSQDAASTRERSRAMLLDQPNAASWTPNYSGPVSALTNSGTLQMDIGMGGNVLAHELGHLLISPAAAGAVIEHNAAAGNFLSTTPALGVVNRDQSANINRAGAPLLVP